MRLPIAASWLFGLLFHGTVYAQAAPDEDTERGLRELCTRVHCRGPLNIQINLENGGVYQQFFELPTPIVQNGWVSIFPGETVLLEAVVSGDGLVDLRSVEEVNDDTSTIELHMWQDSGQPETFLSVKNPFNRTVKYHAVMMGTDSDDLYKTSSCPVIGNGGYVLEHWPHPIFQLFLFDFRLQDDAGGTMNCEF